MGWRIEKRVENAYENSTIHLCKMFQWMSLCIVYGLAELGAVMVYRD